MAENLFISREILARISESLRKPIDSVERRSSSGFNQTSVVTCASQRYFVKCSPDFECLESEADGLTALANSKTIRVPALVKFDTDGSTGFLITEYLQLQSKLKSFSQFAADLARLHQTVGPAFGWHRDNHIGAARQHNAHCEDWVEFFRDRRLQIQFHRAFQNGFGGSLQKPGERLLSHLPLAFRGYEPTPSLLHGDLWQGNFGFASGGTPVVFDPAVYYGDRETDIAMTEMFGGFAESFYRAYHEAWPLSDGYQLRKRIYNLYHILNHLNIFGGGYLHQAETTIERLLSEIR